MDTSKQAYRVIRIDCVAGGAMGEGDKGPRDLPVGGMDTTKSLVLVLAGLEGKVQPKP